MAKKQSGRGRSATLDERYVHDAKVLPVSLNSAVAGGSSRPCDRSGRCKIGVAVKLKHLRASCVFSIQSNGRWSGEEPSRWICMGIRNVYNATKII